MIVPRWLPLVTACLFTGFQVGSFHQKLVNALLTSSSQDSTDLPPIDRLLSADTTIEEEDSSLFFPFTIRDSRRLVANQPSPDLNIFDYVDIMHETQDSGHDSSQQLFWTGYPVKNAHNKTITAPCQKYSVECYRLKILQVFRFVLDKAAPDAQYFFYIESDNELCLPMRNYQSMALHDKPYFISTGIGFSGWIMHRTFVEDFLHVYESNNGKEHGPDIVASGMLIRHNTWSVTRQYLVSHSIIPSIGAEGLTLKNGKAPSKHLPRCFEPRRGRWATSKTNPSDKYGWDYFDYDACPDATVYPCQIKNEEVEEAEVAMIQQEEQVEKPDQQQEVVNDIVPQEEEFKTKVDQRAAEQRERIAAANENMEAKREETNEIVKRAREKIEAAKKANQEAARHFQQRMKTPETKTTSRFGQYHPNTSHNNNNVNDKKRVLPPKVHHIRTPVRLYNH